jgi:hypothetical protein
MTAPRVFASGDRAQSRIAASQGARSASSSDDDLGRGAFLSAHRSRQWYTAVQSAAKAIVGRITHRGLKGIR